LTGFFAQHVIDEIRDRADIVDVISNYVPLKKAGQNFKALCPFHDEKTPSFNVNAAKQIFRCFGCGKGGNVFTFVMEFEKVPFPQAVELVAERINYQIPRKEREFPEEKGAVNKKALYEVNSRAAKHYHAVLRQKDGEEALGYLEKRGISESSIDAFGLGFAPNSWDFLIGKVKDPNFLETMAGIGLVIKRDNEPGYYDRFRNRVMFPIYDTQERVVGFGGRVMDDSEPKYLNSPESTLFSKSRNLYGLNWAKAAIAAADAVAVAEGYTDVILAHQNGVKNVVATLGTAMTAEHARTLKRFTRNVIVVYDGDEAGQKASQRGIDVLLQAELEVRVAVLPENQDPCDFVLANGGGAFQDVLAGAMDFFDYKIAAGQKRPDFKTVSGQSDVIDDILRSVANFTLRNLPKRELLLKKVAEAFGVSEEAIRKRLTALAGAARKPPEDEPQAAVRKRNLEDYVIEMMLAAPTYVARVEQNGWIQLFRDENRRAIAQEIVKMHAEKGKLDVADLIGRLQDPTLSQIIAELESYISEKVDYGKLYDDCARQFQKTADARGVNQQFGQVGRLGKISESEQVEFLKNIEALCKKGESKK